MLAVDPTSKRSGGALLGDRARIDADPADRGLFIRSTAAGERLGGLAPATRAAAQALAAAFDVVVIETVGVGQSETEVAEAADTIAVVVQPGSGDALQFLKSGIMEIPDVLVVTKADLGQVALRARARPAAPRCARSASASTRGRGRLARPAAAAGSRSSPTRSTPTAPARPARRPHPRAAARRARRLRRRARRARPARRSAAAATAVRRSPSRTAALEQPALLALLECVSSTRLVPGDHAAASALALQGELARGGLLRAALGRDGDLDRHLGRLEPLELARDLLGRPSA